MSDLAGLALGYDETVHNLDKQIARLQEEQGRCKKNSPGYRDIRSKIMELQSMRLDELKLAEYLREYYE